MRQAPPCSPAADCSPLLPLHALVLRKGSESKGQSRKRGGRVWGRVCSLSPGQEHMGENGRCWALERTVSCMVLPSLRSGFPTEGPNGADKRSSSGRCSFQVTSQPMQPLIHPLTFLFLLSSLSFLLSIHISLPSFPSIRPSIHPSTHLSLPSLHPFTHPSFHPSIHLSFLPSLQPPNIYLAHPTHQTLYWMLDTHNPCSSGLHSP